MTLEDVVDAARTFVQTYDRAMSGHSAPEEIQQDIEMLWETVNAYIDSEAFYRDRGVG